MTKTPQKRALRVKTSHTIGMVRLLIRLTIFLGSAAIGLLAAAVVLTKMTVQASGFLLTMLVFAVIQMVITPFFAKLTARHARPFLGGVGLITTYVALLAASLFTDGLSIDGVATWVYATLIVWVVTAIATLALPLAFLKKKVRSADSD